MRSDGAIKQKPIMYTGDTRKLSSAGEINRLMRACGGREAWVRWMAENHLRADAEQIIEIVQASYRFGAKTAGDLYNMTEPSVYDRRRRLRKYMMEMLDNAEIV